MNVNNVKALYTNYCGKHTPEVAFEMLVEKYPDIEGDLLAIIDGEDNIVESGLTFQADDNYFDGEVESEPEIIAQPKKKVNVPKIEKVAKKKVEKSTPPAKVPSKAQLAYEIYANAVDKSRKVMIEIFMKDLGLTSAGSSTYLQNCKKKFAEQSV